jgi:hypothetical protein
MLKSLIMKLCNNEYERIKKIDVLNRKKIHSLVRHVGSRVVMLCYVMIDV